MLGKSNNMHNYPEVNPSTFDITGKSITSDSRKIKQGDIFVAIKGEKNDGHTYIPQAIAAGAKDIIIEQDTDIDFDQRPSSVHIYQSLNTRKTYAQLAARIWSKVPELKLAVTGTNGKSSVVGFAEQLLKTQKIPTLTLGTLGAILNDQKLSDSLTTPEPRDLHQLLEKSVLAGAKAAALEASSHGLSQYRLDGVLFDIAAFTNLSRDHLDYHHDMEEYFQAKFRLFSALLSTKGTAVIFHDDPYGVRILEYLKNRKIQHLTYGYRPCDGQILSVHAHNMGQDVRLLFDDKNFDFNLPLMGKFQVENAICSALMVIAAGFDPQTVFTNIANLYAIDGRMQLVGKTATGASVFVDYAHTPQGLQTVLCSAKDHLLKGAKLAVLFGAGGNRDQGKRPLMGKAAHDYADIQYVTDDNPRFEDSALIRQQILQTAPGAVEIADREQAIARAIENLSKGDILIIAGKGHEEGQIIGDNILPFNDAKIAKKYL